MQNSLLPGQGVYPKQIAQDMGKAGFNELAASLALNGLLQKLMISHAVYDELTEGYVIAKKGIDWLQSNQSRIVLEKSQERPLLNRNQRKDDARQIRYWRTVIPNNSCQNPLTNPPPPNPSVPC